MQHVFKRDKKMQYDMKRDQRVSFSEEEVELLNKAKRIIERVSGRSISPNRMIKAFTMIKTEEVDN